MKVPSSRAGTALVAALLFAICSAQDLSKTIDYTTKAVPLRTALDQVSSQAGVKLYPSDELSEEPVILRLKSVTTKEVMDRLAAAVGAEWQDRGKGELMLVRSEQMHEDLRQKALDGRATQLSAAIKMLSDQMAKEPFDDERVKGLANTYLGLTKMDDQASSQYIAWETTASHAPAGRALISILSQLDKKALAAIPIASTAVFSNEPTSKQIRANFDGVAIGEQLDKEVNLLADTLEKFSKGEDRKPLRYGVQDPFLHIASPPTRFILIVNYDFYYMGGLRLKMIGFDKDNHPKVVAGTTLMLNAGGMNEMMSDHTKQMLAAKGEAAAKLSPESLAMIAHMKNARRGGDPPPLQDSLREAALHPEEFDPLNFVFADACLDLAESKNLNAVIYPSDMDLTSAFMAAVDGTVKLSSFEQDLSLFKQGTLSYENGWMTYTPVDRLQAWELRADRSKLGECLRDADEHGFVSIAKAAQLAASERCTGDMPTVTLVEAMYGRNYAPYYQRDKPTLIFYASLDESEKQALGTGSEEDGGLPAGSLTKEQYQELENIAYDDKNDWFIRFFKEDGEPSLNNDFAFSEASREATEIFGSGLPVSTSVRLEQSQGPTYFVCYKSSNGTEYCQNQELSGIAYQEAMHELFGDKPHSQYGSTSELLWICTGESRKLTFRFRFDKHYSKSRTLEEAAQTGNERWTLATLPQDLKSQLTELIEQQKKDIQSWSADEPEDQGAKPPVAY